MQSKRIIPPYEVRKSPRVATDIPPGGLKSPNYQSRITQGAGVEGE